MKENEKKMYMRSEYRSNEELCRVPGNEVRSQTITQEAASPGSDRLGTRQQSAAVSVVPAVVGVVIAGGRSLHGLLHY